MTPSDIIAITAIVLSAIVSVVSGYISYRNNKTNITAKRMEIAFERRLDSFSNMVDIMGRFRASLVDASVTLRQGDLDSVVNNLYAEFKKVVETFGRERVFFPSRVNDAINNYNIVMIEQTDKFMGNANQETLDNWRKVAWTEENKVVALMQEFINLE